MFSKLLKQSFHYFNLKERAFFEKISFKYYLSLRKYCRTEIFAKLFIIKESL